MRSVRAALQLIPKTLKDKLKQNERLTGLYVRSVRKSGLFFDAPTPKQTQALYDNWLKVNKRAFSNSTVKIGGWQAVIFGDENFRVTQQNLEELGAEEIVIVGSKEVNEINNQISQLNESLPTLLINAGDLLENSAISAFFDNLNDNDIAIH